MTLWTEWPISAQLRGWRASRRRTGSNPARPILGSLAGVRSGAIPVKKSVFKYSRRSWLRVATVLSGGALSARRDWQRRRDELGELAEVLSGGGEVEFVAGANRAA